MKKLAKIVTQSDTFIYKKRNYKERMFNNKILSMQKARKFEYDYWDGDQEIMGMGGIEYIPGKWTKGSSKKINKIAYKLNEEI